MQLAIAHAAPSSNHHPFVMLGSIAIAIVFGIFGCFAAVAPLDSAAIAPGYVAAESSTKPLQHLEGGIVREILVKEAESVMEGQVLFRLESAQARANSEMLKKQLDAALGQEARLYAEREGAETPKFPEILLARRPVPETAAVIADQERQLAERRASLDSQTRIFGARLAQTSKELGGLQRQEAAAKDQMVSLSADIVSLGKLQEKGLYPKSKLMALQRERSRLEGQLGGIQGEMARLGEVNQETSLQIRQAEQKFREEAGLQLTEVRARLSDIREKISVADDVMGRIEIRAPQAGVVQAIKVFASGAVIKPGETLADLVPTGDKLVMAVKVSLLDIDSVEAGQRAEVRLPTFSTRGLRTILEIGRAHV